MWSVVVLGGEFILLLFIGAMHGCWLLRGGCFWDRGNQLGTFGLVAPERWLLFRGVVNRGLFRQKAKGEAL